MKSLAEVKHIPEQTQFIQMTINTNKKLLDELSGGSDSISDGLTEDT